MYYLKTGTLLENPDALTRLTFGNWFCREMFHFILLGNLNITNFQHSTVTMESSGLFIRCLLWGQNLINPIHVLDYNYNTTIYCCIFFDKRHTLRCHYLHAMWLYSITLTHPKKKTNLKTCIISVYSMIVLFHSECMTFLHHKRTMLVKYKTASENALAFLSPLKYWWLLGSSHLLLPCQKEMNKLIVI